MTETVKLCAFLVANQLDIKGIKSFLELTPIADTSSELFYSFSSEKYQYYTNYGVIIFSGYSEDEMRYAIKTVTPFHKDVAKQVLRDDFPIEVEAGRDLSFGFNKVVVSKMDQMIIRIAMLNLAQSVALDYYNSISESLLTEVKGFTNQLEVTGKLKISRKNMMRFIGKALNAQNDIAENIYIFDAPDLTWEDEYLDKLNQGLMKHFDLKVRFSEIEYTLKIIENNLSVFRSIVHQRESLMLEFIIIILILVEVFDLFFSKLMNY
jgi:required for meiotic nuclear division protein 1